MFLSWCVARGGIDPSLWWWLVLYIVALVLFPNMSGKGFHNDGILKGTSSTVYPDKSSLHLQKAPGRDAAVGSVMTSSSRPGGLGLVAPEWKPLADSSGLRAYGLPPLHRRGNLRSAPAWSPPGLGRHGSRQLSLMT